MHGKEMDPAASSPPTLQNGFLSVAAHEMRSPIAALKLMLQRIVRRASKGQVASGPELITQMEPALRQLARLERLVSDLLDTGRFQRGPVTLEPAPMELVELVRELAVLYGEQARQQGCELHIEADGPLNGNWDRARIAQIVTNLITNAIKYGRGKPILIRLSSRGEYAACEVIDRGDGVAAWDFERIFRAFERASAQHSEQSLGVGLYIVKILTEAHGGQVSVTSTPAQGSQFTVLLPLRAPAQKDLQ